MSDFQFKTTDFADPDSFVASVGQNQVNRTVEGKATPLKTTRSGKPPKQTMSIVSLSDAAMNSAVFKPQGAMMDAYNRIGQDTIANGIAEQGGPQKILGQILPIAPTDLILKAENSDVTPVDWSSIGGVGTPATSGGTATGGSITSENVPAPPAGGYRSNNEMRRIYGINGSTTPPPVGSSLITSFTWWDGRSYNVHVATVPVWNMVNDIMKKYNYGPGKDTVDGGAGHVVRKITGGSDWSLHSYGIAVDINPAQNPYGPNLITDMPHGMVQEILQIKSSGGILAVRWGGNYSNNKDAMHFEVMLRPEEISGGLRIG